MTSVADTQTTCIANGHLYTHIEHNHDKENTKPRNHPETPKQKSTEIT